MITKRSVSFVSLSLSLSLSFLSACFTSFSLRHTHTHTNTHPLVVRLNALSPLCHRLTHQSALNFIFMHVNESHEGNRTPSRVKRVERGSERILSASVKAPAGWRVHTHTHTHTHRLMPVQRCVTGRSDWEYYLSSVKARQLDMQTLTRRWCGVFSFFSIRSPSLEAITRVILDFNGEIMDSVEGRGR